ncbi:GNAT family protein [Thioalkalivibrio thiocyanodenitrificans]|uniref:N-acetyltransferase n=1 Tax=Thioalkalivibrio thiocyanodenitrificans TaxID=243063 RepID=UPI00037B4FF3|nr:N-acetyltransferase [Thioalkalivibrio thiocyanodenitrificans]
MLHFEPASDGESPLGWCTSQNTSSDFIERRRESLSWYSESGARLEIGALSYTEISVEDAQALRHPLHDLFREAEDLHDIYLALFEDDDYIKRGAERLGYYGTEDILVIDQIYLNPKYRGHKIGLAAIETLIARHSHCGAVTLNAYPYALSPSGTPDEQLKTLRKGIEKLHLYYRQLGFEAVDHTCAGSPVMLRLPVGRYPSAQDAGFDPWALDSMAVA